MRYHLMGICGSGMSGLAEWLRHLGHEVEGCDRSRKSDSTEGGVRRMPGHGPEHVRGIDVLVHSAAVPLDHPEIAAARAASVNVLRRSEMLAELASAHDVIAVAGAHGKSTTSAMTGWALQQAGFDPTVLVGAEVPGWRSGFRPGGRLAVVEADEYDRAFLRLPHLHAAVTSFDQEHLECYGSPEALRSAFETFLELSAPGGGVVVPVEDEQLARWASRIGRRVLTTGPGGACDCVPVRPEGWGERYSLGDITGRLGIPGLQNLRNAATSLALLRLAGLVPGDAAGMLESFPGAARRLERLGSRGGMLVISDYAHHPAEMEASIKALRRVVDGSLAVVFEPHLYSRTASFHAGMGAALALADVSAVLPVFPAREEPLPGVDSSLVARDATAAGADCTVLDPAGLEGFVDGCGCATVVLMGAGTSDTLARRLVGEGS